jgi:hypothetical protein
MKRKYFGWEQVFEFIWQHCDRDGLWNGDAATVAQAFGATEDESYAVLSLLTDRGLIENVFPGTCAITNWRERDDRSGEELS